MMSTSVDREGGSRSSTSRLTYHNLPAMLRPALQLDTAQPTITAIDHAFVSRREIVNRRDGVLLPARDWLERGAIYDREGRITFDLRSEKLHGHDPARFESPTQIESARLDGAVSIDHDCIYLGTLHGHFGHFLLESLSRAWALTQLPRDIPVVFHYANPTAGPSPFVSPRAIKLPSFICAVFDALDLDQSRLVLANKDLRIERLLVPTSLLVLGRSAHSHLPTIYDYVSARLGGTSDHARDIYLTRRKIFERSEAIRRKSVSNEKEIEDLFQARGFEIVAPEELTFADQVALFRKARTIAGTTGSALHMAMFCSSPDAHLIAIDWRLVPAQHLCDLARGLRSDHIYAPGGNAADGSQLINLAVLRAVLDKLLPRPNTRGSGDDVSVPAILPTPELEPAGCGKLAHPVASTKDERGASTPSARAHLSPRLQTHPRGTLNAQRIARIAEAIDARSYLEIGVSRGTTFNSLQFDRKVAVDPAFKFDFAPFMEAGVEFLTCSSDDYFLRKPPEIFDMIFIDGLHVFAQAFRDFCASLALSNRRTVWLIDDVAPSDVYSAMPDQAQLSMLRQKAVVPGTSWQGDVYKLVFAINDFFPSFSFCTLMGRGHPQTLVWRAPREVFVPQFNSLESIERLTYFDFHKHRSLLNLLPEADGVAVMLRDLERLQK